MAKMKCLVFGATGYVGNHIVRNLLSQNIETHAHVRSENHPFIDLANHTSFHLVWCPWEEPQIIKLLDQIKPTHIFITLGTTKKRMKASQQSDFQEDYLSVDFKLPEMILKTIDFLKIKPKIIYLSSLGADSKIPNTYLKARGLVEFELKQSGLETLIFRPSIITGADRSEKRILEEIGSQLIEFTTKIPGLTAFNYLNAITGQELAAVMVTLALKPSYPHVIIDAKMIHDLAKKIPT